MGKMGLELMHRSRLGDSQVKVCSINQLLEDVLLE